METVMTSIEQSALIVILARACLAVLWAQASLHKALNLAQWQAQLDNYQGLPPAAYKALGVTLPAMEFLLALALLSPWASHAAQVSALMLSLYALAMTWQLRHGRHIDCGCGGLSLPVSWPLVWRNMGLVLVSILATPTATMQGWSLLDLVWLVAALLMCVLLYTALHQLLKHAAWMRAQGMNQRGL